MQRAGGSPSTGTQPAGACSLVGTGQQQQCLAESDSGRVLLVSLEVVVMPTAKHPNSEVLWPCGRHAGEVMWLTFQTACNGSWKKERFWRNTDVWPPICPAACKYFWKELQSLVLCVMWSSSGKSWSSSGGDSHCPGWWSLFLDWHNSNLILFFSWICWVLGTWTKNIFKNMLKSYFYCATWD